jgi:iron complex outermembrane receptor protein
LIYKTLNFSNMALQPVLFRARIGIFACIALCGAGVNAQSQSTNGPDTSVALESAEVRGTRAQEKTPLTYTVLPAAVLRRENNARDIPFLLQNVPNAVVASDAGTGMGYTYLRLRGSDQTRINVTLNGVPLNDPESHVVFWVNTPDLTSSLESVQIQRGVGTSTVGTGAFGGSVSLETAAPAGKKQKSLVATGSLPMGYRASYIWESGWIGAHKNISYNGRLTQQKANGYIDRSGMDLKSAAFSGIYRYGLQQKDQNAQRGGTIRFFYLDGQERTQQAWYGIPEAKYRGDSAGVEAYIARNYLSEENANNLRTSGNRTYNAYTYANEIDKYRQTHYQVQWNHRASERTHLHANLFAVTGRGYFEQFKRGESFADYGLPNPVVGGDTVTTTDLVRRRWLENQLVGSNGQVRHTWGGQELTVGYNAYTYVGDHFGTLPWMGTASGDWAMQGPFAGNGAFDEATERRYYNNRSTKLEASAFARMEGALGGGWHGYTDLQVRSVAYAYEGEGQSGVFNRTFFNPKLGVSRGRLSTGMGYASLAVANREPIRSDFIDARGEAAPLPEQLLNAELGYRVRKSRYFLEVNAYAMEYRNQLVPTGALNDVGAALRVNVPVSWRRGVELDAAWKPSRLWTLGGSIALSDNRIASFTEVLYDYAADPVAEVLRVYERTPIALSPQTVASLHMDKSLAKGSLRASLRHVGRQFLDNTGALERSLDAYTTLDLRWVRQTGLGEFQLDIVNATNAHYAPNGYTWGYLYAGDRTTENFVYPMAGVQCMATVRIRLE